jgi:hypothetical protein
MTRKYLIAFACCALVGGAAWAQVPYNSIPDWISTDLHYATGAAWADLNKDGWPDLVIANGNDMASERLAVYYNRGDGTLPTSPSWQSQDIDYNGHVSVGDVNQDGWPDVAVAVLLGKGGPGAKLYLNNGAGQLGTLPAWEAAGTYNAFQCALGDVDLDGDLDLAVGTGNSYYPTDKTRNYVYINHGGVLDTTPSWASDELDYMMDVIWADVDDDGDLDLVGAGSGFPNCVWFNNNGVLATTKGWQSTDNLGQDGNTLAFDDVTGDGVKDLVMSDNNQTFTGSGDFKLYNGIPNDAFQTTPSWRYHDGYVSGVALADIDADGDVDFAGGGWWDYTRIFLNTGSGLPANPSWSINANYTSVVEAIVFGDVDRAGLVQVSEWKRICRERPEGRGRSLEPVAVEAVPAGAPILVHRARRLYYLDHIPAESIESVVVDGRTLAIGEYAYDLAYGWVSLKTAPRISIVINYTYSTSLDMAISNWDPDRGNYLFYHKP